MMELNAIDRQNCPNDGFNFNALRHGRADLVLSSLNTASSSLDLHRSLREGDEVASRENNILIP